MATTARFDEVIVEVEARTSPNEHPQNIDKAEETGSSERDATYARSKWADIVK
jgi:hypothetical protein